MNEVVIILSVHNERGLFGADNLVGVLNAVGPEAIFLEHSPDEYERFNGLEKKAVQLYLVNKQIPVLPCGESFAEDEILEAHKKYQRLSLVLEKYSSEEYKAEYDNHLERESCEGFSYLHSSEYGQTQKWLHEEEERIVVSTGRQESYQLFQWWLELQRNRELAILSNVEKNVLENGYNRAALLIGAEHRNSFLDAAKDSGLDQIGWSCYEC